MATPGQLSLAVTVKLTGELVAMGHAAAAVVLKSAGHVIVGACVSTTVTMNEHMLPDWAVQVTVVAPLGKNEPEAGEQAGVPTPGQLSLAVGGG